MKKSSDEDLAKVTGGYKEDLVTDDTIYNQYGNDVDSD